MNETRQSTEKKFSEAASENKKKRGRPTVYKRDHMEGILESPFMVSTHFHFNGFFPNMLYFFILSYFFFVGSACLPQHLL